VKILKNQRRTNNTVAKRKRTNNDLQNNSQKTKDQATQTPLKIGGELWKIDARIIQAMHVTYKR
jgi:hypothetical protein